MHVLLFLWLQEGEDLRIWKNKMVGHMMGGTGTVGGSYVKKETSITSCFLNSCPPQVKSQSCLRTLYFLLENTFESRRRRHGDGTM